MVPRESQAEVDATERSSSSVVVLLGEKGRRKRVRIKSERTASKKQRTYDGSEREKPSLSWPDGQAVSSCRLLLVV